MNKTELAAAACERTKIDKGMVSEVVDVIIDEMTKALLAGDTVMITNFASISVRDCAPRKGKNPKTGEAIDIAAKRKVVISAGKHLKKLLNAG